VQEDESDNWNQPQHEGEMVIPPLFVEQEEALEENLNFVRRSLSLGVAILIISSMIYIGFIVFGENGLVSYRPAEQALESQEIYSELIDFSGIQFDGNGVRVCIVDSGIMLDHDDLESFNLVMWKDFVQGKSDPYDDHGHGTSMAGILVADGWMKGIAPRVNLLVAKALAEDGSGADNIVAEAIDWCVLNDADIISLSLGGAPDILPFDIGTGRGSDEAVNDAIDQGIFVVAAAGNDGGENDDGDVSNPCGERLVICVGGVTQTGEHWIGSSTGDNNGRLTSLPLLFPRNDPHKKPELVAPAQKVAVVNYEGTWSMVDGTSAATVFVTGALALLLQQNPELADATSSSNTEQVKDWIQQSVAPQEGQSGHDDDYGYGLLKIQALLDAANE
jgi:serine protease AprX